MKEVLLEDWSIIGFPVDAYKSPENKILYLLGIAFGHPDHYDGKMVRTSRIMHADGRDVLTFNTKYHLGKVCKDYKEWYKKTHLKDIDEDDPFGED